MTQLNHLFDWCDGGKNNKLGYRKASVAPRCVAQSTKRISSFFTLGDVHPNVTAKLIHCSLSYFYLITVMTCDD